MKTSLLLLLSCVAIGVTAAEIIPIPAQIVQANGKMLDKVMVTNETLDQIDYTIPGEGPMGASSTTLKRAQIRSVFYEEAPDVDKAKATGAARSDSEKGAQLYLQASVSSPYWRNREECLVLAAEAFRAAKKPDEALKALADLETKTPRSTFLPGAYYLRAQILAAKGDLAGAGTAIAALAKLDPARAAVARAELARAAKKPADAAKELQSVFGSVVKADEAAGNDPSAPSYDSIGFQIVEDLKAAGNVAEANETLLALCYAPIIGKRKQSKAHIDLALSLTAANDKASLLSALDHAIMGGALPGGDNNGGKKAAQKVLEKMEKMPDMADEIKEGRIVLNSL